MVSIAIISFAKFKAKQSRASMSAVMSYAMNPDKTLFEEECLVSGLNCSPQMVYHEFVNTKLLHGKDSGRMYYHMTQSFPKGEAVPPKIAHEMAVKLAEHFKDYEVLICTHLDRDHIHSHFIINSVSFETGRKFHISTPDLEPIRQLNDRLCMEYGFEICKLKPKPERTKSMSIAEYHAAAKGESWKMRLVNTIDQCMKHAGSRAQFIDLMEFEGYKVKWTDTRKSITYTSLSQSPLNSIRQQTNIRTLPCSASPHKTGFAGVPFLGMKCRDDRLHEAKYLKERMELELRIREQIIIGRTQTAEQTAIGRSTTATADAPLLPHNTGKNGEFILQPELDLGRDSEFAGADRSRAETKSTGKNADEQPTYEGGARENQQEPNADAADDVTGWEAEREIFFNPESSIADLEMDTTMDSPTLALDSVGNSIIQLGRAVEQLDNAPVKDSTTAPQRHAGKKKKLAVGQKADDHSGYDFDMKM